MAIKLKTLKLPFGVSCPLFTLRFVVARSNKVLSLSYHLMEALLSRSVIKVKTSIVESIVIYLVSGNFSLINKSALYLSVAHLKLSVRSGWFSKYHFFVRSAWEATDNEDANLRSYSGGSPVGFFNLAASTKIFHQSHNPDSFYWFIPIPVILFFKSSTSGWTEDLLGGWRIVGI